MRRLALLAAAAAALAGCGAGHPSDRRLLQSGRAVFVSAHCGACHAVASVGAHGASGPDFDTSERLSRAQIRSALFEGANGMPSYRGRLTGAQADAVTEFVFQTLRHQR